MPTFDIPFYSHASTVVTIEAETREQAEELAWDELPTGLCYNCTSYRDGHQGIELAGDWELADEIVDADPPEGSP